MFRCCFSIFYPQRRKENITHDRGEQLENNSDTSRDRIWCPAQRLSYISPNEKLNQEASDSDENIHIVQSQYSGDGSHTATVALCKLSSQDLERCASYLSELDEKPKSLPNDTSEYENYKEFEEDGGFNSLRRICSEPIGEGTPNDDAFLRRYRKWNERRSLRWVNHQENEHNEEEEEAALRRMKGSVLRAHSSMTFHF
ncbi:hypothetical protein GpartN1_g2534.t1 [Galdieria partita]|uniref:Uncharacterized protein n=1 Tax=Galdieria partita TaxID=83374 RepID=A0A9C7PTY0_9RHOD|nr:hypothetical protein GpartN1_g2534.t1 [Galdieria partita]